MNPGTGVPTQARQKAAEGPDGAAPGTRPATRYNALLYRSGRALIGAWLRLFHRLEAIGADRLPTEGGALLVINHASFLDIPAVACSARRRIRFVARDTLDTIPFIGWFIRNTGIVYIRRGTADVAAIRDIVQAVDEGDLVAFYPEGTRSHDGGLQTLRPGVLLAARRTSAPIVPVGVVGTFDSLSRFRKVPRLRGRVVVSYGTPFRLETRAAGTEAALETIREAMKAELTKAAERWQAREKRAYPHPLESRNQASGPNRPESRT